MANNIKKASDLKEVENSSKKALTKYDKKVLERKKAEAKEKRNKKIFRISSVVVLIAIIIGIASYLVVRHNDIYGEYIAVGDNEISKMEFDYYYNSTASEFVTTYSSYLSYFNLDTTKSYADQKYSDSMTWEDYFDQGTVEVIKQTKAILVDAKSKGFQYDVTADYNSYVDSIKQAASTASTSLSAFYKTKFGTYATESNMTSIFKDYLTAGAYSSQLTEQNTPSDTEISAYYEANKDKYDSIDYRVLSVSTQDAANEMLSKVKDETSFATLCKTYASDADKAKYESDDASLVKGGTSSSISTAYSAWLYDPSRVAGDKTVLEDSDNGVYGVVYFINRYYEDKNNATISSTIASNAVKAYIDNLTADYTVVDKHNHLKYLSIPAETTSQE